MSSPQRDRSAEAECHRAHELGLEYLDDLDMLTKQESPDMSTRDDMSMKQESPQDTSTRVCSTHPEAVENIEKRSANPKPYLSPCLSEQYSCVKILESSPTTWFAEIGIPDDSSNPIQPPTHTQEWRPTFPSRTSPVADACKAPSFQHEVLNSNKPTRTVLPEVTQMQKEYAERTTDWTKERKLEPIIDGQILERKELLETIEVEGHQNPEFFPQWISWFIKSEYAARLETLKKRAGF